jgi:Terpene cyclase DEP1
MKVVFLLLALFGAVLPYSQLLPWVMQHGVDIPLLLQELFSTRVGAFFGLDVIISAVALITLIVRDGRRQGIDRLWLPIGATCLIGVSCGLPLFLYLRERHASRPNRL